MVSGKKKRDHMLSGWLFLGHRFDTDTFSANWVELTSLRQLAELVRLHKLATRTHVQHQISILQPKWQMRPIFKFPQK